MCLFMTICTHVGHLIPLCPYGMLKAIITGGCWFELANCAHSLTCTRTAHFTDSTCIGRQLPDEHPADGGGQPRLPAQSRAPIISVTYVFRQLPDEHPADGGGQSRLPAESTAGDHQLRQAPQGGRDLRRDPAVPEPALLSRRRARYSCEYSGNCSSWSSFCSCCSKPFFFHYFTAHTHTCTCTSLCTVLTGIDAHQHPLPPFVPSPHLLFLRIQFRHFSSLTK